MKHNKDKRINKKEVVLHLASGLAGFLLAIIFIRLFTQTGFEIVNIFVAGIGIYVLLANIYQLWVIMAKARAN